jgi:hypothetical protein
LDHLEVVAQAHDYFVERIQRSDVLDAIRVDCSQLARQCNYERSKDLVWKETERARFLVLASPTHPSMVGMLGTLSIVLQAA